MTGPRLSLIVLRYYYTDSRALRERVLGVELIEILGVDDKLDLIADVCPFNAMLTLEMSNKRMQGNLEKYTLRKNQYVVPRWKIMSPCLKNLIKTF